MAAMSTIDMPTEDPCLPLGKDSTYPEHYDASLLYPISRALGRKAIGLTHDALPFIGWDLWRCYELSWLKPSGMPCVAILQLTVPATSPHIVESKSLKLYLNSLNHERFDDLAALGARIQEDLTPVVGANVHLELIEPSAFLNQQIEEPGHNAICLDQQDIEIDCYEPSAELLMRQAGHNPVNQSVYSRLLKSNCPVTGQPDWGTVHIDYRGAAIDHAALLRYIVSFRNHQGFHEQCVERIFCDIIERCQPEALSVYARYTRRGGIDINPWRATPGATPPKLARSAQQ